MLPRCLSGKESPVNEGDAGFLCFFWRCRFDPWVRSCRTLFDPMDCSLPGFSIHGIFQAEYWSGLPFPSPGDLPHPGTEPGSPALQADSLPSEPPGKPWVRKIPWRRKWQPTPGILPGKSHGQRSLVGYNPWGRRRVKYHLVTEQQQQTLYTWNHIVCALCFGLYSHVCEIQPCCILL